MYVRCYILVSMLLLSISCSAAATADSLNAEEQRNLFLIDSFNSSLHYQTGAIDIGGDIAKLNVPVGFKFLDAAQSRMVLHDIWGNPDDSTVLGMLFPAYGTPLGDSLFYAFVVTYDAIGYVKDEDADEIDYDEMAKQIKEEEPESNKEREKAGYPPIYFMGWAQKPYFDKERKVLHWAKNLRFGNDDLGTLNYDVRILGKAGILSLNAVSGMEHLEMVKRDIPVVLNIPSFNSGHEYKDFDPDVDKIAAYTIGGLVAGKVLAKTGLFVLLLKFWKILLAALVGVGMTLRKFFSRTKTSDTSAVGTSLPIEEQPTVEGSNIDVSQDDDKPNLS